MKDVYSTIVTPIDNGPGYWNYLDVSVTKNGVVVGNYTRNYSNFFKTFYPFQKGEKWYALYSPKYTATRILSLPDCEDIGGEPNAANGFCPVEYYIPTINRKKATFGFVAGCVWGEDTSWKIEFLDLSHIEEGLLERDDRFGYLELPRNMTLRRAITVDYYDKDDIMLSIVTESKYPITAEGKRRN